MKISDIAVKKERAIKRALLIFCIAMSSTIIAITFTHYFQRFSNLHKALETNISQLLITGDQFALHRLLGSIAKGENIDVTVVDLTNNSEITKSSKSSVLDFRFFSRTFPILGPDKIQIGSFLIKFDLPYLFLLVSLLGIGGIVSYFYRWIAQTQVQMVSELSEPLETLASYLKELQPNKNGEKPISVPLIKISEAKIVLDAFLELWEKQSQEEKRRSINLKNALIARVTTNLRHDTSQLKTVWTAVLSSLKNKSEPVKSEISQHISMLEEVFTRLDKMIKDVPEVSTQEITTAFPELRLSHLSSAEVSWVSLSTIVDAAVKEFQLYLKEESDKDITLTCINTNRDLNIKCNPVFFRRIISNLLTNSYEAISQKGTIEISIRQDQSNAILEIKDTGSGITSENLKRIGQPGFSTKEHGKGIGLSSCKEYISSWGGSFQIESTEEKGASVFLLLPKRKFTATGLSQQKNIETGLL